MINVRRVMVSLLTGSLLLLTVGAQASAVEADAASLAVAERGLALGLQAADDLTADAEDGILVGEGVGKALEVLQTVMARFEQRENPGNGRGPARAIAVHEALLRGELPSSIARDRDGVPGLAKAYGHLRSQLAGEGRGSGANPPGAKPTP
jgi:hypothetical protein